MRWSLHCGAALLVCGLGMHAQAPAVSFRYLYILNCSAHLQVFDMTTRERKKEVDLGRLSRRVPMHGDAASSVVDGCSTYGMAYEPSTSLLYTISPSTGSVRDGMRRFRLLSFHVPGLQPAASVDLPQALEDGDVPVVFKNASGQIAIRVHDHVSHVAGGKLVAGTTDNGHDLFGYQGLVSVQDAHELERSGSAVLIESTLHNGGPMFLVANSAMKHLVRLDLSFLTTASNIHLAPGGKAVLAQEASAGSIPGSSNAKDRVALIDTGSGAVIEAWTNPSLAGAQILTITPEGEIVFIRGESTGFIATHHKFSASPVEVLKESLGPAFFFADK
jgi:hypothetical protein